ncbi:MAG: response regulator, partial [Candidatus Dormibacteraeota bacterium]|nr:response regulator [Candidatus Dormibacteraeota bacterium]
MPRVLVVEDEVPLARLLGRVLSEEGFDPCLEFDGGAALEAARQQPPDAVVLDLSLPG